MHTGKSSPRARSTRTAMRAIAALFLLTSLACGGDDASDGAPNASTNAGATDDALYMVHSAVTEPDSSRSNYFTLTKSLSAEETLDYGKSIVLKGRPRLYAQPDLGFFAIADGEKLSITRYTLDANDQIVAGGSILLSQYGISTVDAQAVHFVSATKAYYKSAKEGQILIFNPTEMTVTRTIDLPRDVIKDGYTTSISQWAAADGRAYFVLGWTTKTYDRVLPGIKLVRIDTATDEVTITDDTRCRNLSKTANVDGALYFFSDVINAFGQAVYPNDGGQPACALRINKGATTFDPSYVGDVAGALRPDQAGTVISVDSKGIAWAQVADLNVTPKAPGTTYTEWYAKGWSWYKFPLATLQNATPVTTQAGAYGAFTIAAGNAFFISEASAMYGKTTLVDHGGDAPKPGLSFAGFMLDVARLR